MSGTKSNMGALGCGVLAILLGAGVLSAVVLPYFLVGTTNKIWNLAARATLAGMNRAQQAYVLNHKTFAAAVEQLPSSELATTNGKLAGTEQFTYSIRPVGEMAVQFAVPRWPTLHRHQTLGPFSWDIVSHYPLKAYVGAVAIAPTPTDKQQTITILCAAIADGTKIPATPIYQNRQLRCGEGTQPIR